MRRKLLVVSHVWPFPGISGQERRVRHTLEVASGFFDVDFLTFAPASELAETSERLVDLGCRPLVLPSRQSNGLARRLFHTTVSRFYATTKGLKVSNYWIGRLELSPGRIQSAVRGNDYDVVLYEYFHAVNSVCLFRSQGVPTLLDTHNILASSLEQRLKERRHLPAIFKELHLARYRRQEEWAWRQFDGLIAINRNEYQIIQSRKRREQALFYAPMGIDLSRWSHGQQRANPPRVAFYGPSGPHNEAAALRTHDRVMPGIWKRFPEAEFWMIGSNPSKRLCNLAQDRRVRVTGYVERVQEVLSTMSLVLCPWSGTYGFRSRIVEVMALGIPVVATSQAVDGMELESGQGILLAETDAALADAAVKLLSDAHALKVQSQHARAEMERLYSLDNTYGRLMREIQEWLGRRTPSRFNAQPAPC